MKDQTSEITIQLQNNTAQTQNINLFDQSDPESGGVFVGGDDRIINYDLSSESFPTNIFQVVTLNYNSSEIPVFSETYFSPGIASLTDLITFLNTLGFGVFTDLGGGNIKSEPNYGLASDNGGLPGAVLDISDLDAGVCNRHIDNAALSTVTGSVAINDLVEPSFDLTSPTSPGTGLAGNIDTQNDFPDSKQITVTGTATGNWIITVQVNGITVASTNGGAGAINWTTPAFTVLIGDFLHIIIDPN